MSIIMLMRRSTRRRASSPSFQDLFVGGRFFGWLPLFSLGRAFCESTSSE